MTETTYIPATDVAKMIRKSLKQVFPTIKFSVRTKSYSGGSSISVGWVNGPTTDKVEKVTLEFEGASFDGMTDLKSYQYTEIAGQRVSFGADFVFCSRHITDDHYIDTANKLIDHYGAISEFPKVSTVKEIWDNHLWIPDMHCSFSQLVNREIAKVDIV